MDYGTLNLLFFYINHLKSLTLLKSNAIWRLLHLQEDFNKRHSAHIPLCPPQFAGAIRDPGGPGQRSYTGSPPAGSSPRSPPDENFPHFHRINGGPSASDNNKISEQQQQQQQYVNRKSSEAGSDISPRSAQNAAHFEISEDQQQRRIRSGSKSSKSSRSSRTSRQTKMWFIPH